MNETRDAARGEGREPEPTLAELADSAVRKIVTAMVISAAVIGLGIYSRPGPPRYQAFAAPDGRIVRVDMRSGTILACEGSRCGIVVRRGQSVDRRVTPKALPQPAAPALTAPAAAPVPAPAPAAH
jgi:hypothetical protein